MEEDCKQVLNKHEQRMATMDVKKLVLTNSIPTIIGMSTLALYNVVDRFWVSQIPYYGNEALAAVAFNGPVMFVKMGFAMLVGLGSAANISIRLGSRDREGAERILGNCFTLAIIISVCITALGLIFREPILDMLGVTPGSRVMASEYYTISVWNTIVTILFIGMNHPIRASGNQMRFAQTQLLAAGLNMVLDPIFILTLGMGVAGAAYATTISMFVASIWVIRYYFTKHSNIRLRIRNLSLSRPIVVAILTLGFSPFLMNVMGSVVQVIVNTLLAYHGELEFGPGNGYRAVSAMAIVMATFQLALTPVIGINQGTQPVVGFNIGAGNFGRVRSAYFWSVVYAVSACLIAGLLVNINPVPMVAAFTDEQSIMELSIFGLRVSMTMSFIIGVGIPTINFFTYIGRPKISIILSLMRQFFLLVPAYFTLTHFFGLRGLWFAVPIAEVLAAAVSVMFVSREFKILRTRLQPGGSQIA